MVGAVLSVRFLFLLLVLTDIFLPFVICFLLLVLAGIFLPFAICLDGGGGGCGGRVGGFVVEFRKSMLVTVDGGEVVVLIIV